MKTGCCVVPAFWATALIFITFAVDAANIDCPAEKVMRELDASYHECNHGYQNGSCKKFVSIVKQLLPKYDCQRKFDQGPVPALWLANPAAVEDYVYLLSQMKDSDARALFASEEFRAVLDGALAETYVPLSLMEERAQKK